MTPQPLSPPTAVSPLDMHTVSWNRIRLGNWRQPPEVLLALRRDPVLVQPQTQLLRGLLRPAPALHEVVHQRGDGQPRPIARTPERRPPSREPVAPHVTGGLTHSLGRVRDRAVLPPNARSIQPLSPPRTVGPTSTVGVLRGRSVPAHEPVPSANLGLSKGPDSYRLRAGWLRVLVARRGCVLAPPPFSGARRLRAWRGSSGRSGRRPSRVAECGSACLHCRQPFLPGPAMPWTLRRVGRPVEAPAL